MAWGKCLSVLTEHLTAHKVPQTLCWALNFIEKESWACGPFSLVCGIRCVLVRDMHLLSSPWARSTFFSSTLYSNEQSCSGHSETQFWQVCTSELTCWPEMWMSAVYSVEMATWVCRGHMLQFVLFTSAFLWMWQVLGLDLHFLLGS